MPKRSNNNTADRWFREIDSATVDQYTILVYETWHGEREDPATKIEKWLTVMLTEKMPEEVSTARDQKNIAPYLPKDDRYSYRTLGEFGGLRESVNDERLEVIKDTDRDAVKHQQESEALLPDDSDDGYHNRYRLSAGGVHYEDFLEAIDRVSENDKDEEAWEIINKWRSRSLRTEERSL